MVKSSFIAFSFSGILAERSFACDQSSFRLYSSHLSFAGSQAICPLSSKKPLGKPGSPWQTRTYGVGEPAIVIDASAAHDLKYWVCLTSLALASLNVVAKLTPSNGPC